MTSAIDEFTDFEVSTSNVPGSLTLHVTFCDGDGWLVVFFDDSWSLLVNSKRLQKAAKVDGSEGGTAEADQFGFTSGCGDQNLAFGRPRNRTSVEHADETTGAARGIRAATKITIGVADELVLQGGFDEAVPLKAKIISASEIPAEMSKSIPGFFAGVVRKSAKYGDGIADVAASLG